MIVIRIAIATNRRSIEMIVNTIRIDSLITLRIQRAIKYTPRLAPTAILY